MTDSGSIANAPDRSARPARVDYGLDAPTFQRWALFGGLAATFIGLSVAVLASAGVLASRFQNVSALVWPGACFFLTGCVMYWGSKTGKLRLRDRVIASIRWRGDERVLDVGCGHGLMLLSVAKGLTTGRAIGIDVWSQADQADNSAAATLANAVVEGVADRIEVLTADAREIPFPDASFDVVLSSFVIHNLNQRADRERVVREIARVLRPGGQLAIVDIRHSARYASVLRAMGWKDVSLSRPSFLFVTPTRVLRARKP